MKRYLLGQLREAEQEWYEQWLMTGEGAVELLEEYEDQLIDDYVHGALLAEERSRFERHFLITPERRTKLRLVQNLVQESALGMAPEKERERRGWRELVAAWSAQFWPVQVAMAAVLVLLVCGSLWLVMRNRSLQNQIAQLQANQSQAADRQVINAQLAEQQARNTQLAQELERAKQQAAQLEQQLAQASPTGSPAGQSSALAVISLLLLPGRVRDDATATKLTIPTEAAAVQLKLELEADDYLRYQVQLQQADGGAVWQQPVQRAAKNGQPVAVRIPASRFQSGDYAVRLSGVTPSGATEEVGKYYFRVVKQ